MKTPQQIIYDSRDWKALEKKLSDMSWALTKEQKKLSKTSQNAKTRKQGAWLYYD